jgi:peptidoglycan/LPS O-acetylase OafA/YrhL
VQTPYPTWTFYFMIVPAIIFWSALSYAFIERPFLKMRPRTTPQ